MAKVVVVGTSHVSPQSMRQAQETIRKMRPDCVAVELCPERYQALIDRRRGEEKPSIREPLFYVFYALQNHLGKKTGTMPGSEMLAAIESAREVGSRIVLIDMDIGTISGKIGSLGRWEKAKLLGTVLYGATFGGLGKKVDLSKVPPERMIDEAMTYLKKSHKKFYKILVEDRNDYMVAWIRRLSKDYKKIVVVVGAGHKKGIERMLRRKK